MGSILFGLRIEPTNNFLGTDGSGGSISIYENGLVRYHHFEFDNDAPVSHFDVKKDSRLSEDVKAILAKHNDAIRDFPEEIDNQTMDGEWYIFTFYDKKVTIDNPSRYDKRDFITLSKYGAGYAPPYEKDEEKLCDYNNALLNILDEIIAVLDQYGLPRFH